MRRIAALLLLAPLACSDVTAVAESEDVRVERDGAALLVTNGRDQPIHYFAVGERTAPLVDWIACVGGDPCPSVPAQSIRRITGFIGADEDAVLFYWWQAQGASPGPLHMLRID